jgi:hypothetical protein
MPVAGDVPSSDPPVLAVGFDELVSGPVPVDDPVSVDEPVTSLAGVLAVEPPDDSMVVDVPSNGGGEKQDTKRRPGSECLINFAPGAIMPQVQSKRP